MPAAMAADLVWSPQARADLVQIYIDIGLEEPLAAERYFDRIEEKVLRLMTYPRMGVRRADIRPSTRMLVEVPYVILYETVPDTDDGPIDRVEIVRVVSSRRDLLSLA
jgi:toxin ParE1/3/4